MALWQDYFLQKSWLTHFTWLIHTLFLSSKWNLYSNTYTIFGLKMTVKSGLEKFILKSLHDERYRYYCTCKLFSALVGIHVFIPKFSWIFSLKNFTLFSTPIIFWPGLDPLHNVQNNHDPVFNPNHNVQKIFSTKRPNKFYLRSHNWNVRKIRLEIRLTSHTRNFIGNLSWNSIAQKLDYSKGKKF